MVSGFAPFIIKLCGVSKWASLPGGIPSTHSNTLFSYPPHSWRFRPPLTQADLKTSRRPALPPSLPYPAIKSATPGHGMTIARTRNAPCVISASSASANIRRKAAQNGSTPFPHAVQTPLLRIDYLPFHLQLLRFQFLPLTQPKMLLHCPAISKTLLHHVIHPTLRPSLLISPPSALHLHQLSRSSLILSAI